MDVHKFGGFLILLGIGLFIYGTIVILTNLDRKFDSSESKVDPFFGRMDLQNALEVRMENQQRASRRSSAIPFMVTGGIVVFIGLAMRSSSKKNKKLNEPFVSPTNKGSGNYQKKYCSNCGSEVPNDAGFCSNCGSKVI